MIYLEGGVYPGLSTRGGRRMARARLRVWSPMNIRFISTLTPEDEERLAPGVVNALGLLLDQLPLAYTLRVETSGGKVFQHAHTGAETLGADSEHLATRPLGGALRTRQNPA